MNIIVTYRSKTGFAKTYATYIQQALGCDMAALDDVSDEQLLEYDIIMFGGGLYASGINGIRRFTRHYEQYRDKHLVVFACGATPGRDAEIADIVAANFTPEQRQDIPFFYLRGGFDFDKLGLVDKILMTLLKWKLRLKRNKTGDERGMLEAYAKPVDFTKAERVAPIVAHVRQLAEETT